MRQVILDTQINLSDMLNSTQTGRSVKIFQTRDELIEYTVQEDRYFRKEDAYAGSLLRYFLREIHNDYYFF
ncbi:hypothetical protein LTR56_026583 [Elasticomyces elasticus]|nr:hypothetical protein LTR56_026583 [Elasticomyces elasticus]